MDTTSNNNYLENSTSSTRASATPKFTGISIFNTSIGADGSCECNVRFNGDALAGTKCSYVVYVNNNTFTSGNINGLNNVIYLSVGKVSSTTKSIVVKVEATNGSTSKTSAYTFTIPTVDELKNVNFNVTHKETNPASVTTDPVTVTGLTGKSQLRYTIDGTTPSASEGTVYSGSFEIPNNVETTTIKWFNYCNDANSGVQTVTITHLTESEKPKVLSKPTITQDGYALNITNTQAIESGNNYVMRVSINNVVTDYELTTINQVISLEPTKDSRVFAMVVDKDSNKNFSDIVTFYYTRPTAPVITLAKPILTKYNYITTFAGRREDGTVVTTYVYNCGVFVTAPDSNYKYVKAYYTIDGTNPSTTSNECRVYSTTPSTDNTAIRNNNKVKSYYTNVNIEIEENLKNLVFDNFIFKCRLYYKDEHENEYLSDIASVVFMFDDSSVYFYGYNKPELTKPKRYNYLDIINNTSYEDVKALDSISYLLNVVDNKYKDSNIINVSSINLKTIYSGDELMIYSDQVNTGNINIHIKEEDYNTNNINGMNRPKLPYIDKGNWNFNYFRSDYPDKITDSQLTFQIPYYDASSNKVITKSISYEDMMKSFGLSKGDNEYLRSNVTSLVYGKYFVARFIFHNDVRFKLENIKFNLSNY